MKAARTDARVRYLSRLPVCAGGRGVSVAVQGEAEVCWEWFIGGEEGVAVEPETPNASTDEPQTPTTPPTSRSVTLVSARSAPRVLSRCPAEYLCPRSPAALVEMREERSIAARKERV